jgi:phosphate transport system substrate-binding protein
LTTTNALLNLSAGSVCGFLTTSDEINGVIVKDQPMGRSLWIKRAVFACFMLFSSFKASAETEVINIMVGHSPYANLIAVYGPGFEKETGIKLNIIGGDSVGNSATDSFRHVLSGKADIGGSGVYWNDYAKLMLKEGVPQSEIDLITHRILGSDVMKVVVNEKVNLEKVSMAQLSDLFSGKIKNWKEIGGPDELVVPIIQTQLPGTTAFFKKTVLKTLEFAESTTKVPTNYEMLELVAKKPGAIAFCSSLMPEAAKTKTLKTEDEISRPLTLITKGKPKESVLKFFKYIDAHRKK